MNAPGLTPEEVATRHAGDAEFLNLVLRKMDGRSGEVTVNPAAVILSAIEMVITLAVENRRLRGAPEDETVAEARYVLEEMMLEAAVGIAEYRDRPF